MIGRKDVEAAFSLIRPHVRRTPVIELPAGALGLAAPLALKLESLQVSGTFKGRGAFHKLLASKVQAAGIIGVGPATLANGNNVCWEIWNGGYTGQQAAAALLKTYPTLTTDQAAHFVIAAYQNLCPVPGAYDYWAYSTS